jgi:hypothetical protein
MFGSDLPEDAVLASGGAAKFLAFCTLATWDDTVTVTGSDRPGGERRR